MRVLVTGGSGFIGRAVVRELAGAGHEVRVLTRDRGRAEASLRGAAPVDVMVGEPIDRATVRRALEGRDALIHAAGTYSYDRRDGPRMLVENPAVARAVLGAALDAGTPRVVDISTTGVFSIAGQRVDETTPLARAGDPAWGDPYIQSKVLAELAGRELEARGLPRVAIHPAAVVGPEDRGPGTSGTVLVRLMRGRIFPRGRLGWVDVREVARAIVAGLDARPGSAYILSHDVLSLGDVAHRIDRLTERRRVRRYLRPFVAGAIARANERLGAPYRALPAPTALAYTIACPPVIDGSRARRDLGVCYRPFDDTLIDAIRWWVKNRVIEPRLAGRLAD